LLRGVELLKEYFATAISVARIQEMSEIRPNWRVRTLKQQYERRSSDLNIYVVRQNFPNGLARFAGRCVLNNPSVNGASKLRRIGTAGSASSSKIIAG
jgi:hypothetical protein